jgi:hypothetical protein
MQRITTRTINKTSPATANIHGSNMSSSFHSKIFCLFIAIDAKIELVEPFPMHAANWYPAVVAKAHSLVLATQQNTNFVL